MIDGVTDVEGVSFARFFDEGCIYDSFAIGNNPLSPDAVHPMHLTTTTKFNVSLSSLVFYYEPDMEWIVQEVVPSTMIVCLSYICNINTTLIFRTV